MFPEATSTFSLFNPSPSPLLSLVPQPDLSKFGMTELENDIVALMKKRVWDVAGCNDKTLKVGFAIGAGSQKLRTSCLGT